jgi:hypothetical protein
MKKNNTGHKLGLIAFVVVAVAGIVYIINTLKDSFEYEEDTEDKYSDWDDDDMIDEDINAEDFEDNGSGSDKSKESNYIVIE